MRLGKTITVRRSTLLCLAVFIVVSGDLFLHLVDITYPKASHAKKKAPKPTTASKHGGEKGLCKPGVPCAYSDPVDFRIILMTFRRAKALQKTLIALDDLVMDGDSAALEIWIDRDEANHVDNETLKTAKAFKWKVGRKRVNIQQRHVGIYGQWIDTWRPKPDSKELVLLLEDDVTPSRYAYRWLKTARHHFSSRSDVMGYTLQSEGINRAIGKGPVFGPSTNPFFLYRLLGSWGFSPKPTVWRQFQDWYHEKAKKRSFKPYVPDLLMTKWYKKFETKGTHDSMWTMWFIYYTNSKNLYCVYNNLPTQLRQDNSSLAVHRREAGLHFHGEGLNNSHLLLTKWDKAYVSLPKTIPKIEFDGTINIDA